MSKRRFCIITDSRADYGLLSRLIGIIQSCRNCQSQLVATNMYLSPESELTYRATDMERRIIKKGTHL